MTWLEFIDAVEAQGVQDDTEIGHITWHDDEVIEVIPYAGAKKVAISGEDEADDD